MCVCVCVCVLESLGRWDRKVLHEGLRSPSGPAGPLTSHLDVAPRFALGSSWPCWNPLSELPQGAVRLRCFLSQSV